MVTFSSLLSYLLSFLKFSSFMSGLISSNIYRAYTMFSNFWFTMSFIFMLIFFNGQCYTRYQGYYGEACETQTSYYART